MDLTKTSRMMAYAALPALALGLCAPPAAARDNHTTGVDISDSDGTLADLFVADNTVLDGGLCVGDGCVDQIEIFGTTVMTIKDDTTWLTFDDTSQTTSGDPYLNWTLRANDAAGAGARNRFVLRYWDWQQSGQPAPPTGMPLIVEAAPDNSLVLSQAGLVGMGTALPQEKLHLVSGTPGVRIERDGSGGYPAISWTLKPIGTSGLFGLIRDGATTPFSVSASAEANAFTLNNDAAGIGVSTGVPRAKLHIDLDATDTTYPYGLLLGDGSESGLSPDLPGAMAHIRSNKGNALLKIEETSGTPGPRTLLQMANNGRPEIVMGNTNTGGEWSFGAGTNFVLKQGAVGTASSAKTKLFEVQPSGDAVLTGSLTTGGSTCGGGCDAVFSDAYDLPSISEHAAAMYALGYLPNVGPTPENTPINVSDKLGRMLNELEHAHIYIASQDRENREQADLIAAQQRHIAALNAHVAGLSARLGAVEQRLDE